MAVPEAPLKEMRPCEPCWHVVSSSSPAPAARCRAGLGCAVSCMVRRPPEVHLVIDQIVVGRQELSWCIPSLAWWMPDINQFMEPLSASVQSREADKLDLIGCLSEFANTLGSISVLVYTSRSSVIKIHARLDADIAPVGEALRGSKPQAQPAVCGELDL